MKKRCLHVFSTFDIGGPQVRFANMVNHLPRDIEHLVIAMDGQYQAKEKLYSSANVTFPDFSYEKSGNLLSKIKLFKAFLDNIKPDFLITYNWGTIEWAMTVLLKPHVKHLHFEEGFGPEEQTEQLPRRVWTRRIVLPWKARVIVPSETLRNIALNLWKLPPKQVKYLANGIDLPINNEPLKLQQDDTCPLIIGTLARLRKEKNIKKMLQAISSISIPVKLKIGGSGDQETDLQAYVKQHQLEKKVEFCGQQDDPHAFMQTIDLFCLSSDTEQMPLSVLEAMANNLVVVATDVGDVKNMVTPSNQSYIKGISVEDLKENLNLAISQRDSWPDIGQKNAEKVKSKYSVESMNEKFLAML
jgi:glycosyltransferase involved in cell wall biosynthesis